MPWEGNGYVICIDDRPVGKTLLASEYPDAIAHWLNDGALKEIETNAFVEACEAVSTVSKEEIRARLGKTVGGR